MALDADDRLRLDYERTTRLLRSLTDIRFRLLAFVPTFAGASVGFFGRSRPAAELLAVGVLGLVATLGVYLYELRNSQLYVAAAARTREIERQLELPDGLVAEHDSGLLALVYGAALAGWSYLVTWGLLHAFDLADAREIGLAIGIAVGLLIVIWGRDRAPS
jgi:hypothetical protein